MHIENIEPKTRRGEVCSPEGVQRMPLQVYKCFKVFMDNEYYLCVSMNRVDGGADTVGSRRAMRFGRTEHVERPLSGTHHPSSRRLDYSLLP